MLVATFAGRFAQRLDSAGWRPWVDRAAALEMIGFGAYLFAKA
jgi:hypothetical protein